MHDEKYAEIDDDIQISYYPDGSPKKEHSAEKIPAGSSTSQLLNRDHTGGASSNPEHQKINFSYSQKRIETQLTSHHRWVIDDNA